MKKLKEILFLSDKKNVKLSSAISIASIMVLILIELLSHPVC